jgi:uncharacterized protein YacL
MSPSPNDALHPQEAAERQRTLLLRIVRLTFGFLLLAVTLARLVGVGNASDPGEKELLRLWYLTFAVAAAMGAVVVAIDMLTPRKKIATMTGVFGGLLAGLIATAALSSIIDLLANTYMLYPAFVSMFKVLLGICLCYLGVTIVLQTQDDFRLVIPYVEFAKQIRGPRPLLVDTSALIDARIADLCQTGIIQYPVVIPRFVIAELQLLADSHDRLKRARGRRGLDVITRMQRTATLDISIDETPIPGKSVDQMLVELARRMEAVVLTSDVGMSRVATIQGVRVLNLNEVANSLKPALIPGEQLALRLIKPGEQPGQGVGYLDDGTMVVAEDGRAYVGSDVTLTVTSSLQTSAGRLIFGRVVDGTPVGGSPAVSGGSVEPAAPAKGSSRVAGSDTPPGPEGGAQGPSPEQGGHSDRPAPERAEDGLVPTPVHIAPAAEPPGARGPFPPKPPSKRVNPFRNPRR